ERQCGRLDFCWRTPVCCTTHQCVHAPPELRGTKPGHDALREIYKSRKGIRFHGVEASGKLDQVWHLNGLDCYGVRRLSSHLLLTFRARTMSNNQDTAITIRRPYLRSLEPNHVISLTVQPHPFHDV